MGLLPSKIRIEDLKPGDQIYTWRRGGCYSHHGIYKGNGEVIDVDRGPGGGSSSSAVSESSDGRVRSCSIEVFLSGGELYRFEYGVNALRFLVQRPGTCTCVSSDPPGDVVARAESLLRQGIHAYDLCDNNCEDFAFYCKTELADVSVSMKTGSSGQIALFVAAIISFLGCVIVLGRSLPKQHPSFIDLALMFCVSYSSFRLLYDARIEAFYPLRRVPLVQYMNSMPNPGSSFMRLMLMLPMALLFFRFNPKTTIFQLIQSVCICRLTSQRSSLNVYIMNSILALVIFCFTPEGNVFQEAKTFYLYGFLIVLAMNPLKLRQYVDDTLWLHVCSLTFPEGIPRLFRLVCLSSYSFKLVADLGSRGSVMPLEYVLNCARMLIFWYWTQQDTDLQWMRFFLLSVCLFKFVANLRNRHLRLSEYAIALSLASKLQNWTQFYPRYYHFCFMVISLCCSSI